MTHGDDSETPAVALRFTGSGAEYFRIWAVNLTLTILTLGLYSAWAKVRRLQYFYRNTELDGAVFDYTASPLALLLGRVVALGMLVLYYAAFNYSQTTAVAMTAALALGLPYLLWQSNRFKARNTSYRGISFSFVGSVGQAYRVYLPAIVVTFGPALLASVWPDPRAETYVVWLSLGAFLLLPVLHAMYRRYVQANLRYGDTPFDFSARASDFAAVWAWGLGVMIVGSIALAMVLVFFGGIGAVLLGKSALAGLVLTLAGFASVWLSYLMIGAYFTARFQTLVWAKTRIGNLEIRSDISATRLLRLQALNTLWVVLTLGVYRPYAAIRLARYRLECMSVLPVAVLDEMGAAPVGAGAGAAGESVAELFELDIGI